MSTRWEDQVALFKMAAASSPTGGIEAVIVNAGIVERDSAITGRGFENPEGLDQDHPAPPPLAVLNAQPDRRHVHGPPGALLAAPERQTLRREAEGPPHRPHQLRGRPRPYPASLSTRPLKHALVGLFRSLRGSVWRQGIRCNMIGPYFVDTPLMPKRALYFTAGGPMTAKEDVVDAATRLVADESISGRGFLIGPKLKVIDGEDGEQSLVEDEGNLYGHAGQLRTQAVWEINAHDYERVDLFVWRYVGALNLIVKIKGFFGLVKEVIRIIKMDKP